MKLKMNLMFTVMMVLTSSSQTRDGVMKEISRRSPQKNYISRNEDVSGPDHAGNFSTPDQTKDPKNELPQWTHNPAGWNKPSADTPTTATAQSAASTETGPKIHHYSSSSTGVTSQHTIISSTASASLLSAAADNSISSSTAANITSTTEVRVRQNLPAFSSPTDAGSKAPTSSRHPQSESLTTAPTHNTGPTQTSAFGWALVGPTHQEVPPKLNVEDEDLKGSHRHSSSPLDPLLAGLLSVFIVTTAIVFIALFFKFRQRTNHPEFHRLQDLPMDDLMEDTPLSRYTH